MGELSFAPPLRVAEHPPPTLLGVDPAGRVVLADDSAAALLGVTAVDLLGRALPDLLVMPDRTATAHDLLDAAAGALVTIVLRRPDGDPLAVAARVGRIAHPSGTLHALSLRAPGGFDPVGAEARGAAPGWLAGSVRSVRDAIVGAAHVSRAVTVRHRDDAKFRWLFEATALAVIGVNADGVIELVNSEAQRLFHYTGEELRGQSVEILLPEVVRDRHARLRATYVTDPRTRRMGEGRQLTARRRDGSEFPAEISLASIQTEEGLLVAATVHDVSARVDQEIEHRRLENELQRSQRLASLGQLAGGVAHDFNNLLAIISTHASLLEEDLETMLANPPRAIPDSGPDLNTAREAVGQVLAASERGARLTRQLLAFGRREVVRSEVFDLNDVVRDVVRMLTGTLGADIVLRADLAPRPAVLTADPGRMEQVLVNLAVNARDAMPSGGLLTFSTDHRVLGRAEAAHYGLDGGAYVRLQVVDDGTGMAPDVAERAFEPFFSTKAEGQGTGLGLASVYGILTQASGVISLESELGVGTTVTILLPSADRGEPERPAATEDRAIEPVGSGYGTILLVDDERELRASIQTILVRAGYTVLSAASGAEGIELAGSYRGSLDLLLTDITMPGLSGREVADQVRAMHPSIQVLYMSGFAQRLLTSTGTLDPEARLIEKPFSRRDLLAAVAEALRRPV